MWMADLERAALHDLSFQEAGCAVAAMTGDMNFLQSGRVTDGPGENSLCSLGAAFRYMAHLCALCMLIEW